MIFLFGESVKTETREHGRHECPVCNRTTAFKRCEQTRYFTLFGVSLLSLGRLSDYRQCDSCGNSFAPGPLVEPAVFSCLRRTLVYIMMGYSRDDHLAVVGELYTRLTGKPAEAAALKAEQQAIAADGCDLPSFLRARRSHLNDLARQKIVEAAFLMTYVSCELQREDRVRINLIGNALDLSLDVVGSIIDRVRSSSYYGIRRKLPVH